MTKRHIREQQRANSKKLAEDGLPLIRQHNFPKSNNFYPLKYRSEQEMERRKRQIDHGQLKAENGLVA